MVFSEVSDPRYVFHWRPPSKSQGSCIPVWKDWPGLWAPAANCLAFVCSGWLIRVRACYLCQSAAVGFFCFFNGTNLLSSCRVFSMKALYWQRTLGCRAGLTVMVQSIIRVIPRGARTFLMRAEAGQAEWGSESWRAGAVVSRNNNSSGGNLIAVASLAFIDVSNVPGTLLSASHAWSHLNLQQSHEPSTISPLHVTEKTLKVTWPAKCRSGSWTLIFWMPRLMPYKAALHSLWPKYIMLPGSLPPLKSHHH